MPDTRRSNGLIPGANPAPDAWDAPCSPTFTHRLRFTVDAFNPKNDVLRSVMMTDERFTGRVLACIDAGVHQAWPDLTERLHDYFNVRTSPLRLVAQPLIVTGGEAAKNDRTVVDTVVRAIHEHRICRRSFVLAIGGGAMLDAVGFAAATAHRGVRLVRMPTTTLTQDDTAIGVKNGINAFGKKNFLGTFSPPWAVINDERFLETLSNRDWRSGLSEAVKVAIVKDASLFDAIEHHGAQLGARSQDALRPILRRCAELHMRHIVEGGDPFETDEARPLDFGHWAAHKLEQMTAFELRHGEAVAIGIAIDTVYAAIIGLLPWPAADRVCSALQVIGFELHHDRLAEHDRLLEGLEEFREHLGGRLTISLPKSIGHAVDVHEIDRAAMMEAIDHIRLLRSAPLH
ncbi:MAG TPA: 3-dehydroquinate synthase [Phycisphaerales bacterium]|nr:3-dehydroquinate synthase [Phycisphaerales bacterium]